jgi:hypothetical protein
VPVIFIGEEPAIYQPGKPHLRHKPIDVGLLLTKRQEPGIASRNSQDLTACSPEDALQQLTCDGIILDDKNGS